MAVALLWILRILPHGHSASEQAVRYDQHKLCLVVASFTLVSYCPSVSRVMHARGDTCLCRESRC